MRKKIIALLMCGLMISLAACGSGGDIGEVQNSSVQVDDTYVSENEDISEPVQTETGEFDCIADFNEAQKIWFKFDSGLECDFEDIRKGDIAGYEADFYRVTEPGIGTLDDLKNYLSMYVDESFAAGLVDTCDNFEEFDGALYVCPAGRGDDLTQGWVEYETEPDKLIVKVHRNYYFDELEDWYENGTIDTYEFPFTVVDGHAKFDEMFYLCGWAPNLAPEPGHDGEALEAALIGLIAGKWENYIEDTHYEIEIGEDGSYTYYVDSEVQNIGWVYSSRNDDYSYMLENEETSNTLFYLGKDVNELPILEFENGNLIYEKEGQG